ncbi:MAG: tetratricopeptide repeat protein [Thermodesulfobacteriota bacterium]
MPMSKKLSRQLRKHGFQKSLLRPAAARQSHAAELLAEGQRLAAEGRIVEAAELGRQALRSLPGNARAYNLLGIVAAEQGQTGEAAACFRRAIAADGGEPSYHINLGNALETLGLQEEGDASFRHALALDPRHIDALNNFGLALLRRRMAAEAAALFERLLKVQPDHAEARCSLGMALSLQGRTDEAIATFNRSLELAPGQIPPRIHLGLELQGAHRYEEAEACLLGLLKDHPGHGDALVNLGNVYMEMGLVGRAVDTYRQALSCDAGHHKALHNYLFALLGSEQHGWEEIFLEHRQLAGRLAAATKTMPAPAQRSCGRGRERIRIGYLSPDFRRHSVAHFIAPLLAHHDRQRFEVFCYSCGTVEDDFTTELRRLADQWRSCSLWPDRKLAEAIREDRIDILIDLAGHTAGNRLPVFAARPAPVQLTYLGYPASTGLDVFDFRITDGLVEPAGAERFSSEKLLRLPGSSFCYDPVAETPPVAPPPFVANGAVTFGSTNNHHKLTPGIKGCWAEILRRTPGATLLLKARSFNDPRLRERLTREFAALDIGGERLRFAEFVRKTGDHLLVYNDIDICLDTGPYNGATTTCEALWMGVPVVSLAGDRPVARMGLSILTAAGLGELAVTSPGQYVEAAGRLAGDLDRLATLRAGLRQRLLASPLLDGVSFAHRLENGILDILRKKSG